jgi:hypothetical protein
MSVITPIRPNDSEVDATMHAAWWSFLGFVFLPVMLLAYILPQVLDKPSAPEMSVDHWVIGTMIVAVACAISGLFIRSRLFQPYARGEVVRPRRYLHGMVLAWATMECGVLVSFVSCMMTHLLLYGLAPGAVAFVVLLATFPGGNVMVAHDSDSDDPALQHEAR